MNIISVSAGSFGRPAGTEKPTTTNSFLPRRVNPALAN